MNEEKIKAQARAMLFWGEPRAGVSAFLAKKGIPEQEARALIDDAKRERFRAVRLIALRRILIGLGLLSIPAVFFWIFGEPRSTTVRLAVIPAGIGVFGLWKLIDGFLVILLPRSIHGSISELDE